MPVYISQRRVERPYELQESSGSEDKKLAEMSQLCVMCHRGERNRRAEGDQSSQCDLGQTENLGMICIKISQSFG